MANKYSNNSWFTTKQVQKMTKVSARKLRWWDQQGLLKPRGFPGRESGQRRRYTLQDVICALVIKGLRDKGVSLQKIRETVDRIKITGIDHPLSKFRVACLAHTVIVKKDGKYLEPISGQMVIDQALEVIRPQLEHRRFAPAERAVKRANHHYKEKVASF